MGTHSRKSFMLALTLLSLVVGGAKGQWRIVAPKAVPPKLPPTSGVLTFKDGIFWAGNDLLYSSTDSGATWRQCILPYGQITAISFLNRDTGMVAVPGRGLVLSTTDGGNTWVSSSGYFEDLLYSGKAKAYGDEPQGLSLSSDNGSTWTMLKIDAGSDFGFSSSGNIFSLDMGVEGSSISFSTDAGTSWTSTAGSFDRDSWSLGIDSCDPSLLYVVSENYYAPPPDSLSKIFRSTDRGANWQSVFSSPIPFLSGSFTNTTNAEYAGTTEEGFLRSTDQGLTWENIGGPGTIADSRTIYAMSDNVLYALDSSGNIWVTDNSGGDSVHGSGELLAIPPALFSGDTLYCDSLQDTATLIGSGCSIPSLSGLAVVGSSAGSFTASQLSADSIVVILHRAVSGAQHAQLILNADNGSSDTVQLAGYVNINPSATSVATQDVKTDTLGATVRVPITINGLTRPEDVDLILHYDGSVDYVGSFSPSGAPLDKPGEQWPGRSALHIAGATPGVVAGYANFNVFSDSGEDAHATFDSLDILTAISPCEYSSAPAVTSTIFPPKGCGVPILSQLVHLGKEPVLSVRPNPAAGSVWITASNDIPDATLAIYDMLGSERGELQIPLRANVPTEVMLPVGAGVYTVAVRSSLGVRTLRVVRER